MPDGPDLSEIRQLEERLLAAGVRHSLEALDQLLADDFFEIGASGKTYDKSQAVALLLSEQPAERTIADWTVRRLARGVALANYRVQDDGSLRTSIWVSEKGTWRIVFHQGTPASA